MRILIGEMSNRYRINISRYSLKDVGESSEVLDKSKLKAMEFKGYKYFSNIKEETRLQGKALVT